LTATIVESGPGTATFTDPTTSIDEPSLGRAGLSDSVPGVALLFEDDTAFTSCDLETAGSGNDTDLYQEEWLPISTQWAAQIGNDGSTIVGSLSTSMWIDQDGHRHRIRGNQAQEFARAQVPRFGSVTSGVSPRSVARHS
jgi:hypothetical protein